MLLGSDAKVANPTKRGNFACGFYWTEGNTGIGWAIDSIPPLKGGSSVGIPSPPAIWFPKRRLIATPTIEDAERLQGFPSDWTSSAKNADRGERLRWRLVGNAVSIPVANWIAERLATQSDIYNSTPDEEIPLGSPWPDAAWGVKRQRRQAMVSTWPVKKEMQHLASFLKQPPKVLSLRATSGFYSRLQASGLKHEDAFAADLAHHISKFHLNTLKGEISGPLREGCSTRACVR